MRSWGENPRGGISALQKRNTEELDSSLSSPPSPSPPACTETQPEGNCMEHKDGALSSPWTCWMSSLQLCEKYIPSIGATQASVLCGVRTEKGGSYRGEGWNVAPENLAHLLSLLNFFVPQFLNLQNEGIKVPSLPASRGHCENPAKGSLGRAFKLPIEWLSCSSVGDL